MNTYEFTVMLAGVDLATENLEDQIVEAGCDDALLCFCGETPYLEFARNADTAETAINTALTELAEAGFLAASIQEAGYVTVTGAAAMADIKKSTLDHYAKGRRGKGFPAPLYGLQTGTPLYWWPEIAEWLVSNNKTPSRVAEIAKAAVKLAPKHSQFRV
ncbi:MAG: XRE family transcriptional regulator [Bacterioplanes sp.]|nr:XRE family transcriptional regulator [Bacterioplanes sp.]